MRKSIQFYSLVTNVGPNKNGDNNYENSGNFVGINATKAQSSYSHKHTKKMLWTILIRITQVSAERNRKCFATMRKYQKTFHHVVCMLNELSNDDSNKVSKNLCSLFRFTRNFIYFHFYATVYVDAVCVCVSVDFQSPKLLFRVFWWWRRICAQVMIPLCEIVLILFYIQIIDVCVLSRRFLHCIKLWQKCGFASELRNDKRAGRKKEDGRIATEWVLQDMQKPTGKKMFMAIILN